MCAKTAEQTKLLIAAGADVNARNYDGKTALMYAKTAEQKKLLNEVKKTQPRTNKQLKKYLKTKPRDKRPSGVVFADAIALLKRAGIVKGDVTPEQAKALIEKMNQNC